MELLYYISFRHHSRRDGAGVQETLAKAGTECTETPEGETGRALTQPTNLRLHLKSQVFASTATVSFT